MESSLFGKARGTNHDQEVLMTTQENEGQEGGSPHTSAEEGHPAGDGERSDREIGGPTSPDSEPDEDVTGGGPSKEPADEGFDSHS